MIVQRTRPHRSHDLIRNAQLTPFQSGGSSHVWTDWPENGSRKDQDVGSRRGQAIHLLPSDTTDPVCTQPERKAVQNSDSSATGVHLFVSCIFQFIATSAH